jgi:hypothetical protein
MKPAINRKPLQVKLNHLISAYVKSVTDANSKKINKAIKKSSKNIAKAVTKHIKDEKTLNPFWEKSANKKRKIKAKTKSITKVKVIKKKSAPKVVRKIRRTKPVKIVQKKEVTPPITSEVKKEQEITSGNN